VCNFGFSRTNAHSISTAKSGVTKTFTSAADAPAFKLSFLIIGMIREEFIQDGDDEWTETGKLELEIKRQ